MRCLQNSLPKIYGISNTPRIRLPLRPFAAMQANIPYASDDTKKCHNIPSVIKPGTKAVLSTSQAPAKGRT